ncbi:hypothetical protein E3Q16_04048 [Wallemia mellicola]|uniref:Nucleolar protein 16 n=1 Tax=Wallemia mellicola TaxID=1708541 RepID=A0AB74KAD5_9BASI|nr:hypothetical protein E3Q24_03968 [Wallemia mellicola]TIB99997.1 hypothetical protein E3Q16_04048 [Wallemia mellicola]TIC19805.1 hypothetical protein E3Q12_04066 [Wallemia mellicola]TIC31388.1 hypothetical protein E3Q09_04032 [Wallemia mellicola]TIC59083.1 hypothetical protein E3Q03_04042 [Wallemia mellicola]
MAKPRQRSKQKSGSYRPTKTTSNKGHRKTTLKNVPAELARQWDKSKTLRENYARLGLASNLKMHAVGGVEKELPSKMQQKEDRSDDNEESDAQKNTAAQMGRIVRDDEGNVVDVIIDEPSDKGKAKETPWGQPLDSAHIETPSVPLTFDDEREDKTSSNTDVVKLSTVLEAKAATARPVGRNTSADEWKWLIKIVKTHGRDLEEASRDLKINTWQKTKGELSRAVKRAGGFEVLEQAAQNVD